MKDLPLALDVDVPGSRSGLGGGAIAAGRGFCELQRVLAGLGRRAAQQAGQLQAGNRLALNIQAGVVFVGLVPVAMIPPLALN